MDKRKIIIGTYDTALTGLWTLAEWVFEDPTLVESYIEVPGRIDGPLDASTALSDGDARYGSRALEALLTSSEGTRLEREARISAMVNQLDGKRFDIVLPDDPTHHIRGRVRVSRLFNNLVHGSVKVTATCEPWRYNNTDTVVAVTATATEQTVTLVNMGRRAVAPALQVIGGTVNIAFGVFDPASDTFNFPYRWALGAGEHPPLPDLFLTPGTHPLKYSGTGTLILTYREAVL